MTDKIVALKPATDTQEEVVALLERYLEDARRGEIRTLGIVCDMKDGRWRSESTTALDRRLFSAMLMELGIRGLGIG